MNAPFASKPTIGARKHIAADAALVAMIDAWTKHQITDAYSFRLCTEEMAIKLIRDHGLRYA